MFRATAGPRLGFQVRLVPARTTLLLQEALPQLGQGLPARGTGWPRSWIGKIVAGQSGCARRPVHERRVREPETGAAAGGHGARAGQAGLFALFVGPAEEGGDELEDLEFFRVGAVEGEEVEEVVGY